MEDTPFKEDILGGKVALVTGGSSGIGFEITRQLGKHGASVVIVGRRGAVVDKAVAQLQSEQIDAEGCSGDVRSPEDAERAVKFAVEKFGCVDILVNCAAGNFLALPEAMSTNAFRTVMDIDTVGTFNFSRAAFPALKSAGAGKGAVIINISATLHYGATWYQAHASAAKAAVDSLTRSLGLEWGSFGIRVCGVAPGPIGGTAGMTKLAPGRVEEIGKEVPIGRLGRTQDIALACVFLASPAASYITGETLVVDGGAWLARPQLVPREKVSAASRGIEGASRKVGIARVATAAEGGSDGLRGCCCEDEGAPAPVMCTCRRQREAAAAAGMSVPPHAGDWRSQQPRSKL